MHKEIPRKVHVKYYSAIEVKKFEGEVSLPYEKLDLLFKKYEIGKDSSAKLVVGMAPGGWIRVWFQTLDKKFDKYISIEVAKAQLKGYEDDSIGKGFKDKESVYWKKYKDYWQLHGIPYEAWANNEKEYDIIFNFGKSKNREVGFSYVSADGTYYQGLMGKFPQKLPVQFEQIAW